MKQRVCPNFPNPCYCTGACMKPEGWKPPTIIYVGGGTDTGSGK